MSLSELVRSTSAVLALSAFALTVTPPADAQIERAKLKPAGPTTTTPTTPAPRGGTWAPRPRWKPRSRCRFRSRSTRRARR